MKQQDAQDHARTVRDEAQIKTVREDEARKREITGRPLNLRQQGMAGLSDPLRPAAQQYHDLIFDCVRLALAAFTAELAEDTYALALVFDTVKVTSGQVIQCAVELTYNTLAQWKTACSPEYAQAEQAYLVKMSKIADMRSNHTPKGSREFVHADDPLRPGTVKWNYIYWCHDVRARIPRLDRNAFVDPLDQAIREDWCRELGIAQVGIDWTDRPKYDEKPLAEATLRLCGTVAASMHSSGLVQKRFGKPIPVFIHALGDESGGDSLAVLLSANPPESTAEFLWHREEVREHRRALRPPQLAQTIQIDNLDEDVLPDGSNPTTALQGLELSSGHVLRRDKRDV